MFEFFLKDGICMWPILFCSVVGLAIFLERFIRLGLMHKRGQGLETKVTEKLKSNNDQEAYEIASRNDSPWAGSWSRRWRLRTRTATPLKR